MRVGEDHPLYKQCRGLLDSDPGNIAVGIINLDTRTILTACHDVAYFSEAYVETVMAATVEMFRGQIIERIDDLISVQQSRSFERHIQEVYFRTPRTHHFLNPIPETSCALILVTGIHADRDAAWETAKTCLPGLAPHCPRPVHF